MARVAAIYTRVLGDMPMNEDNRTAVQLLKCKEYCRQNGYVVREDYVFSETRPSVGHDGNRPAFDKMMGLATQDEPPFKAVVVLEYARFMRDRDQREMAQDRLLGKGIRLLAIKDGTRVF